MTERADLLVASLGPARHDSPLADYVGGRQTNEHYVHEDDRVVPFGRDGPNGFLCTLHQRVKDRGNAVVVVAEGAGQDIMTATSADTDPSGNARLSDIGVHLKTKITDYFAGQGSPLTLKYIDPGYMIRSVRADPHDSVYCVRLAQAAVHAGMAGRTDILVGHGGLFK